MSGTRTKDVHCTYIQTDVYMEQHSNCVWHTSMCVLCFFFFKHKTLHQRAQYTHDLEGREEVWNGGCTLEAASRANPHHSYSLDKNPQGIDDEPMVVVDRYVACCPQLASLNRCQSHRCRVLAGTELHTTLRIVDLKRESGRVSETKRAEY